MNCVRCHNVISEVERRITSQVHFICAKGWLVELLRHIAPVQLDRWSKRIDNAHTPEVLERVGMLVGQALIKVGSTEVNMDLFQRWFVRCIGPMPAREAFARYEEPAATPDRSADPRPRREARLAPAAASAR